MSLILNEDEVVSLTDYKKPRAQCRQLQRMGIVFELGRTGKPKVLRNTVLKRLGGAVKGRRQKEINSEALNKMLVKEG